MTSSQSPSTFSSTSSQTSASASSSSTAIATESNIVAKSKLKPGAIAGIFLGVLTIILLFIVAIWFILRRRRGNKLPPPEPNNDHVELEGPKNWAAANRIRDDKPELINQPEFTHPFIGGIPGHEGGDAEPFPSYEDEEEADGHGNTHSELASPMTSPHGQKTLRPQPGAFQESRSEFAERNDVPLPTSAGTVATPTGKQNYDTKEEARLYAEERRLSSEIAEAERLRELKAQKLAVSSQLELLRSASRSPPT